VQGNKFLPYTGFAVLYKQISVLTAIHKDMPVYNNESTGLHTE